MSFAKMRHNSSATDHTSSALSRYMKENDVRGDADEFATDLYQHVQDTIGNRILEQHANIPNELLYQLADKLFGSTSKPATESTRSENCVLEVCIHRAEGLSPEDVTGTSDPYCLLGLAEEGVYTKLRKKKQKQYATSIKDKNLNPEWNECIEIPVNRDQISDTFLHIQVWDHDDDQKSLKSAIGELKHVKGVRGVGTYMKEVAQAATHKGNNDDFMGFIAIPIKSIPLGGLVEWHHLHSSGSIQGNKGQIKIGLKLTCPHTMIAGHYTEHVNGPRPMNKHSNEIIYGGILSLIVNSRHTFYTQGVAEEQEEDQVASEWDGQLEKGDDVLLHEFASQRKVDTFACAIAKLEAFVMEHTHTDGIQMETLNALLKELQLESVATKERGRFVPLYQVAGKGEKCAIFASEKLPSLFDKFLRHCYRRITDHVTVYPTEQRNMMTRFGDLLLCLKNLSQMSLYLSARQQDANMVGSADLGSDVSNSLGAGMDQLYKGLCVKHQVAEANVANQDDDNATEEYNVSGLVNLVCDLRGYMVTGHDYYLPVFKKVLDMDYMAVVLATIRARLADDLRTILDKVNSKLSATPALPEDENEQTSIMFQLYFEIRKFLQYTSKMVPRTVSTSEDSNTQHNGAIIESDADPFTGFHNWFQPTILRWLEASPARTTQRLTDAVKIDEVTRVDDIVKHSSSAVDATAYLNSHVVTRWRDIAWPDPVQNSMIAKRIVTDIFEGAETYADLIHNKLKAVGFFDDEGQFDVTEELCFTLNNLEKVKLFLSDMLDDMEIKSLATDIGAMKDGPSAEEVIESFETLLRHAETGMQKKIREIVGVVGKKMQPDVMKYVEKFSREILTNQSNQPQNRGDQIDGTERKSAITAIGSFMEYLQSNLETLDTWLCKSNFRLVLDVIWQITLQCLRKVTLPKQKNASPGYFRQCKYILQDRLTPFFHEDGAGLQLEEMRSLEEYVALNAGYEMGASSTKELTRQFLSEMYKEQLAQERSPVYGHLNVHAWYDWEESQVKLDVISAENLTPQDRNGYSDPYVQISLMPKVLFPAAKSLKTRQTKKTLNPYFDESFSFNVSRELVTDEEVSIVFTVFDYDVVGQDDLEGECIIPLSVNDGFAQRTGEKSNRNFKLALIKPQLNGHDNARNKDADNKESAMSPWELLQARAHFDREAKEFSDWRKKILRSARKEQTLHYMF